MSQVKTELLPEAALEYEELLRKLPGVAQAKFVLDQCGQPVELHILADRSRNPKQIVRDIQSALLAQYGLEIDHRIISVAQADLPVGNNGDGCRLICGEVSGRVIRGGRFAAWVVLEHGEERYQGQAEGSDLPYNKRKIVAQATIMAVEAFLQQKEVFTVLDVETAFIAGQQAVLSSIALHDDHRRELLIGAVYDQGDSNEAVVKATLDAINRRIQIL